MATNISSSLTSYSSITQKSAKFNFPVNFPLKFTIESSNISYNETSNIISNTTVSGSLLLITPIKSTFISNSNISGSIKNNSNLASNGLIDSVDIDSNLINTVAINSNIEGDSLISVSVSERQLISPAVISPTSNITGIPTSMFKLITNIIANTSIAILSSNYIELESTVNSNTSINGNLINLIDCDLLQVSEIEILKELEFPLTFPFNFLNGLHNDINLSSDDISSNSSIINNRITNLIIANLKGNSVISGEITCNYAISNSLRSVSNVSANLIQSAILKSYAISSDFNIEDSEIIEKLELLGRVAVNSNINGSIRNSLVENADFNSLVTIQGDTWNVIESIVESETFINFNELLEFPLEFPFNFEKGIKNIASISSSDLINSIVHGNIRSLIESEVEALTIIHGQISSVISIVSSMNVSFGINDVITDTTQLSGSIISAASINGNISINNKLVGTVFENSSISGAIKSNLLLKGNIVSNSNFNAVVSYLYFIAFEVKFIINLKDISEFKKSNTFSYKFIDHKENVFLNNITEKTLISDIRESELLNTNEKLSIKSFSYYKDVTIQNIYEKVTFTKNITSLKQLVINKEISKFTNEIKIIKF
ncbi:hypothetical protein [Clostridium chromiireducens]|uniref:Uncharacterized protein n=1 Tax=Clostridium chromiireducens TaxID=225345 RepID=A0A1V4IUU9_9CLOT|nr:hypothetical protein [Clostridium chromiireducens]OPJ63673.1 hypothetical protein CLCHR_14880 [Clostridium chromiireducens]